MSDIKKVEIDPFHIFRDELSLIENRDIKDILNESLQYIPDYFWIVPASSSGKYHPKSSLGIGGLVRHTKAVFNISEEILSHPTYTQFSDLEKDTIRAAILLHDTCKQGAKESAGHTLPEHPLLVGEALYPLDLVVSSMKLKDEDRVSRIERLWGIICDLIETHMGVWNTDKDGRIIMDEPHTNAQLHVHISDYLASRKIIEVDVNVRREQAEKDKKSAWEAEEATVSQIDYIRKLSVKCMKANTSVPEKYKDIKVYDQGKICITKKEASDIIEGLKKELEK